MRYLKESRIAFGYQNWLRDLTAMRDASVHVAIYGSDKDNREMHSGRAQVYSELLALFTATN